MHKMIYIMLLMGFSFAQFNWGDDGLPLRQGLHIEWQRSGDANSDGSMIYAWSDCRNGVRDIVVQKIDINGNNLWGENGTVIVNAYGRQEDPQLVTDGSGGAFVIWMDYRDESDSEGDIYAQHIDSNGIISWGLNGLALVDQPGQQASPNICSDGQGGAFVIWKDNTASSYGNIVATHITSEGAITSGQGTPIITYPSYRSNPSLNTGGSGSAVLVWSDDRNSDIDLYAQKITVGSNVIIANWGEDGKLVSNISGDQTSPRVAPYSSDQTIVTWEDARNNYTDVYYQILDENGNGVLTAGGVSACVGEWQIIKPRVKAFNSIAFIVWEDRRNGWESDIYAQKINSDGVVGWENNGKLITDSEGSQSQPRLSTDGNGGVYFVWEDHRNSDVTGIDIYSQHIDINGNNSFIENGQLICNAANLQFNPLVRNDGNGGALIIWGDQRSGGSYGMYSQHITTAGISLDINGKESFFGIATDAANEPYNHGAILLDNNKTLVYWQDNRGGASKVYGSLISNDYGLSDIDYFNNSILNGQQLSQLDFPQEIPNAILAGDKIFLSYKVEESPNENLYYQLLNYDLTAYGNAVSVSTSNTSKQSFSMTYGADQSVYYAYSEDYDIQLKKIDASGNVEWTVAAVTSDTDDIVKSIYPMPGSGCMIIYQSESFLAGTHIYAVVLNANGEIQQGWPLLVSNLPSNQYYEDSILAEDGVFISFKDDNSSYSIYGQYILFSSNLGFEDSGLNISGDSGNQQSSSVGYNTLQNEVLICYETSDGYEIDLSCNEVGLISQYVSEQIVISSNNYSQKNPYVYWTGHSYLISWEDSRLSSNSSPKEDLFFQEYKNGTSIFPDGGAALTIFDMKQESPVIIKSSDDSFLVIWEDYRSTGKEFCANLYAQAYTTTGCPSLGDMNGDGGYNVLDIVALANCVLAGNCNALPNGCAGDMNGDGGYNVLDIVALANCVLAGNCG